MKTATISLDGPCRKLRCGALMAQNCDLFLAIGSSLVIGRRRVSAAGEERWCKLVIINNEPTEQDDLADLVIRHDIEP